MRSSPRKTSASSKCRPQSSPSRQTAPETPPGFFPSLESSSHASLPRSEGRFLPSSLAMRTSLAPMPDSRTRPAYRCQRVVPLRRTVVKHNGSRLPSRGISRAARFSIGRAGDNSAACTCELRLYRPCPSMAAGFTASVTIHPSAPILPGRILDFAYNRFYSLRSRHLKH